MGFMFQRRRKTHTLFGMQLRIDPGFRDNIEIDRVASNYGVDRAFLNGLEDGKWRELSYSKLLYLTGKAAEMKSPAFRVEPSELWATFHKGAHTNRILLGKDLEGRPVRVDYHGAQPFIDAFEPRMELEKDFDVEEVRGLMADENVIAIGGSKVNTATRVALEIFSDLAKRPVRFAWPMYVPKSPVEGNTKDGTRTLQVGSETYVETPDDDSARYGLVAVCRNPLKSRKDVTTAVIAGCSVQATEAIAEAIQDPLFTRLCDPRWAGNLDQRPVFFVFESQFGKVSWHISGNPTQKPRKAGRPRKRR